MIVFFAILNVSGINSEIIYTGNQNEVKNSCMFLKQLVHEMVEGELIYRSDQSRGISVEEKIW